jgi:hypothetical protein
MDEQVGRHEDRGVGADDALEEAIAVLEALEGLELTRIRMIHADRRAKAAAFTGDARVLTASLEVQVQKLREELGHVEGQTAIERLPMTRQQRRAAASRMRKQTKKLRREAATVAQVKKAAEAIRGRETES